MALSLSSCHQELPSFLLSSTIPSATCDFPFLELYPEKLLLGPAPSIQSGIGGVNVLSTSSSSNVSRSSFSNALRMLSKLGLCGMGLDGRLSLLIRLMERRLAVLILARSDKTCPAPGAAVTTVPGVAAGAGVGESDLKSG